MEHQARRLYGAEEATPSPISNAAMRFDSSMHLQTQQCELALHMVGDNPASVPESQRFEQLVQTLFLNRLVLNAPVEYTVAAYPDPVWGISLDRMATPRRAYATPRTRHRQTPRRSAGFSFGTTMRGDAHAVDGGPARPMLPSLRLYTQQPTEHALLADSHYALGGFSDDRPLNWKGRSVEVPPKPKRKPWTLDTSIWSPRKHGPEQCDARDYYNTVDVYRSALAADWESTTGGLALAGKEPPSVFGISPKKLSPGKAKEVHDALAASYPELWMAFQTFCCHLSATSKVIIFGINKFGYSQLIEDGDLLNTLGDEYDNSDDEDREDSESDGSEESDGDGIEELQELDLLWTSVTCATISKKQAKESNNHAERLIRWEFLEWVVRAAIARRSSKVQKGGRFVKVPPEDVANAVTELCNKLLANLAETTEAKGLPNGFMLVDDPNTFRQMHCYHEQCDAVLREHEVSLRNLYVAYAKGDGNLSNKVIDSEKKLSLLEWGKLVQDLGFTEEIGERSVVECFIRARMLVVGELTEATRGQQNTLTFEDYLEALVRLALVKVIPSDVEISAANHRLAGEYLAALGPSGYRDWYARETQKSLAERQRSVPSHRRLKRLIEFIIYTIEHAIEAKGAKGVKMMLGKGQATDGALTTEEISLFRRHPKPFGFEGDAEVEDDEEEVEPCA